MRDEHTARSTGSGHTGLSSSGPILCCNCLHGKSLGQSPELSLCCSNLKFGSANVRHKNSTTSWVQNSEQDQMMKLGFDISQNLKALPGTTSFVLRLRRLKIFVSSLPHGSNLKTGPATSRMCVSIWRRSWLFSQERHKQDCQSLGNSSFKCLKGRGGNSFQKRNQDGKDHRHPNSYSRYYFSLLC